VHTGGDLAEAGEALDVVGAKRNDDGKIGQRGDDGTEGRHEAGEREAKGVKTEGPHNEWRAIRAEHATNRRNAESPR